MALTDKQQEILIGFLSENANDVQGFVEFLIKNDGTPRTPAEQKSIVETWWTERKAKLEADKATLNQAFLDEQIARIDSDITDGDGLITNL